MISVEDLKLRLQAQYSIKCFTNLVELSHSPTSAYRQLQSYYQSAFDPNDRLIFYTSDKISDALLQHLYKACNLIDISNFFILLCSPYDLDTAVLKNAQQVSTDPVPFHCLKVDIVPTGNLQNNFSIPNKLCPMPWMNLEIRHSGDIRPCCVYTNTVGHVDTSTLQDVFYGQQMSQLRQQFIDGMQPSGCKNCWQTEAKGLTSNRTYHMRLLQKELLTNHIDNLQIRNLDLKPGNTCNFKCRICSPVASSLHEQEVKKFQKIVHKKTFNWAEDTTTVVDEIVKLLPNLTNIDMYGGEPFLIKPLYHLVNLAVEGGYAANMRLHYNSNGSIFPEKLIESWKFFRHVDIHFSIDNIGPRFELERGGSWQDVDRNIKKLLSIQMPNVKISVALAINIMNIYYIDEVLAWAESLGLSVNPVYVSDPQSFALTNLTAAAKKLIIDKFTNSSWPEMQKILRHIDSTQDSNGKEFVKLCRHFDNMRNQNFSQTHPEIAKAMGY